jgi:hypothetical protein
MGDHNTLNPFVIHLQQYISTANRSTRKVAQTANMIRKSTQATSMVALTSEELRSGELRCGSNDTAFALLAEINAGDRKLAASTDLVDELKRKNKILENWAKNRQDKIDILMKIAEKAIRKVEGCKTETKVEGGVGGGQGKSVEEGCRDWNLELLTLWACWRNPVLLK